MWFCSWFILHTWILGQAIVAFVYRHRLPELYVEKKVCESINRDPTIIITSFFLFFFFYFFEKFLKKYFRKSKLNK